jgi:hypothetical protein
VSVYRWTVSGTAADGQTWETSGTVESVQPGNFPDVCGVALQQSFMDLTRGRAVFGQPGVGCRGPYKITRLLVEIEP